jgi:Xaa-Pro aminopeptidase
MILTVEPGLYFRKEYSGIDTEFEGIGVRIEDDVLITDTGHLVLTESIPKELHQLEFGKVK